jgi:hypothetical protein
MKRKEVNFSLGQKELGAIASLPASNKRSWPFALLDQNPEELQMVALPSR